MHSERGSPRIRTPLTQPPMGKTVRCRECGKVYRELDELEDLRDNDSVCLVCNNTIEVTDWDRILASFEEDEGDVEDVEEDDDWEDEAEGDEEESEADEDVEEDLDVDGEEDEDEDEEGDEEEEGDEDDEDEEEDEDEDEEDEGKDRE